MIFVPVDEVFRGRVVVLVEFHFVVVRDIPFLPFDNATVAKPVLGGQCVFRKPVHILDGHKFDHVPSPVLPQDQQSMI
jgi:hypothetical protein